MKNSLSPRQNRVTMALGALILGTTISACSSGGSVSDGPRQAESTKQGTAFGTPVLVIERWIAYLADEASTGAGGTDFNGDLDMIDSIAAVVNMATKKTRVLDVSADDMGVLRAGGATQLYTVTDEAKDGFDWSGDGPLDDVVLLHTTLESATPLTYIADVDSTGPCRIVTVDNRLYFTEEGVAPGAGQTTLMYVAASAPTVPVQVLNNDAGNSLDPEIMGCDEGLIFLAVDETAEGRDLNTDLDFLDEDVLALLDGTTAGAMVHEVPLAMADDSDPFRALSVGTGNWLVGFLVDETDQDATNLNDPTLFGGTWKPPHCVGFEDADVTDRVLHFLDFAAFTTNRIANPPINTGLVGDDRIVAVRSGGQRFLGVVSPEGDEGTCDLNGDGDQTDDVIRWTSTSTPILPLTDINEILALEDVPGGTEGITDLDGRFICVVSESDDGRQHDDDLLSDDDLIAWLDPLDVAPFWEFDHSNPGVGTINSVGTGWCAERQERDRFLVAFPEAFGGGGSINSSDGDVLDSVATFALFDNGPTELDFPGPAVAVDEDNVGTVFADNLAFFRVDEAADNRNWNGDKDKLDHVLFRSNASNGSSAFFVSTLNDFAGPAAYVPEPGSNPVGIAFVAEEAMANRDFNKDGDKADNVLRWFRID